VQHLHTVGEGTPESGYRHILYNICNKRINETQYLSLQGIRMKSKFSNLNMKIVAALNGMDEEENEGEK
jgi:hypothetical protein